MHPIAPRQDHIGPMAATLADAWLTAQQISATAGGHNGHPGLGGSPELPAPVKPRRLAWLHTLGWNELDAGSKAAFDRFLSDMRKLGVDVVDQSSTTEIAALEKLLESANEVSNDVIMYEGRWPIVSYLEKCGDDSIGKAVLDRIKRGTQMTRDDYCAALSKRNEIRRQVHTVAALVDGFVTLASSGPAPFDKIDETGSRDRPQGHLETGSRSFLSPWSMVGGPSFSLPLLAVDGMPVGVQLMGVTDSDEPLTGIAHWLSSQYDR
jgi:Asp-tRNA(Asn)/Glu-tRNA(Gln) amidotransferase A subunit family amidase